MGEDKFKKAAGYFRALDYVPLGMCVVNKDYIVLFWNSCLEDWTGIKKSDITGKSLEIFFPHFSQYNYRCRIDPVFEGGPQAVFYSYHHRHIFPSKLANGRLMIQHTIVVGQPDPDEENMNAIISVEDVTELTNRIQDYMKLRSQSLEEVKQHNIMREQLKIANIRIKKLGNMERKVKQLKELLKQNGGTVEGLIKPVTEFMEDSDIQALTETVSEETESLTEQMDKTDQRISKMVGKIKSLLDDQEESNGDDHPADIDRTVKILMINENDEDYEIVHNIVKDSEKIDLYRAVGFQEALNALDKNTFDMIISDCQFDGRDDAELLQLLARYGKKVPVVVITGAADDTIATDVLRSSACEYLFKEQLNPKILFNVINKTLKNAHPQTKPIPIPK